MSERLDLVPLAALLEDLGANDLGAVLDAFFDFAPTLAEGMDTGARSEDRDAVIRAAHTLKSNAATLGAMTLASVCERLETEAASAPWREVRAQVEDAQRLLASALEELKHERSRLNGSA